ncbi:MAG: ABC transporter permease [Acidimicrobiia bacterium]
MSKARIPGRALAAPLVGLVVFLAAWEALVRITNTKPFVLRSPSKILAELADSPGAYFRASLVTGREAAVGLLFALAIALVVGAVLSSSRFLEEAAQPVLTLILVTPWVAYISSVVLWLGRGTRPILFVTTLVCIPAFVFATVIGLRSADPLARELLRSVDAGRIEILWRLRLPSALPSIFAAARFNAGLALAAAYFTEGGALVNRGLGAIGRKAASFNEGDPLWAAIFCTAALGMVGLGLIGALERLLLSWHSSQRSAPDTRTDRPGRGSFGYRPRR